MSIILTFKDKVTWNADKQPSKAGNTCYNEVQHNDSTAVADDDDDDDDDNDDDDDDDDDSRNCLACQQCPQDAPQTLASPQTPGLWPDMLLAWRL